MHLIDGKEVTKLNAQLQVDVNLKKDLPIPTENAFKRGADLSVSRNSTFSQFQSIILINKSHKSHESYLSIDRKRTFHFVKLQYRQSLTRKRLHNNLL